MTSNTQTSGARTMASVLLFCAGVVNFFDRAALSVANTPVRAALHLDATAMGWLLSAFSLAYGLAQLPLVAVLARVRPRFVLGGGLALWSAAQLLTGAVRGLPSFLALRALLGTGEAPFYPCGVQIVRSWFPPRERGRATAAMSMSQTLGLAVAPPVLTLLLLRFGWRILFALLGAGGLLVAGAWMLLYRDPAPRPPASAWAAPAEAPDAVWRVLLRRRTVWGMMLGFGGINYTNWLYITWMPGYLEFQRHLSLARTGWVAAVPFLAGAAGMLTSGAVADLRARQGASLLAVHRVNLVAGMVLSALATVEVARASSTVHAVAGISVALFGIHFAGTSGWGYAQTVAPAAQVASLSALQNFASFVLASAAPVVTGMLLDRTHSFSLALEVCTGVTLLGAGCYATLAAPDATARAHASLELAAVHGRQ